MYYPASDTIAAKWPQWQAAIEQIDQLLHDNAGQLVRVDFIASFVDESARTVGQILDEYVKQNLVELNQTKSCPMHPSVLFDQAGPSDGLHCDLCDSDLAATEVVESKTIRIQRLDESTLQAAIESQNEVENPYRFLVAISFAGDNKRNKVREVAEILRHRLGDGKVFFDEFFEAEIAGHDADNYLQEIYLRNTLLVVTCVCKRYDEKPWTQEEWRAIRAFERQCRSPTTRPRFLPLRFGDGEVDGILANAIVPDVRHRTPEAIAKLILDRLKLVVHDDQNLSQTVFPAGQTEEPAQPSNSSQEKAPQGNANPARFSLLRYIAIAILAALAIAGAVYVLQISQLLDPEPTIAGPDAVVDPSSLFTDMPTAEQVRKAQHAETEFVLSYRNLSGQSLDLLVLDFAAHYQGRSGWRELPLKPHAHEFLTYRRLFNGAGWYGLAVRLRNAKLIPLGCHKFLATDPSKWKITIDGSNETFWVDEWRER